MIFVTGDTHGLANFSKLNYFAGEHPELTKDDYVIIAGDFGGVIDNDNLMARLKYYTDLPFTVLFADGNHENFDLLETFPVETWNGGKVRKIKPNIIHLMRGQVFELQGKTIFTFGGATSTDRHLRVEGVSWWSQELPTQEEFEEGLKNLARYNFTVDYVITHTCGIKPFEFYQMKKSVTRKACLEVNMLSEFDDRITCKHWYFGHFHMDLRLSYRYTVLLENIIKLE